MSETPPASRAGDAAGPCCPAVVTLRRLVLGAIAGLIIAAVATLLLGPTYEATAYLEAAPATALPTLEEKLRFPSLYRAAAESDEAARDLAQRTRVRVRRGSQLMAVIVSHSEPAQAAAEADRLAEVFLASVSPGPTRPRPAAALPDAAAADSPQSLSAAWTSQRAEFEKLAARYGNDAAHPAVVGARERLDGLRSRILDQVATWRRDFGLAAAEIADPAEAVQRLLADLTGPVTPAPADFPGPAVTLRLAEPASVPAEPVGPPRPVVWLGGAVLGAFLAFLVGWCCPACCAPRRP